MSGKTVKVTLDVIMPIGATKKDLEYMCKFLFLGHFGNDVIAEKFDYELDVDNFKIE